MRKVTTLLPCKVILTPPSVTELALDSVTSVTWPSVGWTRIALRQLRFATPARTR